MTFLVCVLTERKTYQQVSSDSLGGGILGGAFFPSLYFLIFSKLSTVSIDYFYDQKKKSSIF